MSVLGQPGAAGGYDRGTLVGAGAGLGRRFQLNVGGLRVVPRYWSPTNPSDFDSAGLVPTCSYSGTPGSNETRLLLAKAASDHEASRIGDQTGGRVFLFLHTDDFERDHRAFTARGVRFCEAPRHEPYGTVAVFEDLYGNRWDLIQPAAPPPP